MSKSKRAIVGMMGSDQSRVFISYCHKDSGWLRKLQTVLEPLARNSVVDLWADTRIRPGSQWRKEIEKAIATAKVALLLVTPDFLASSFVVEDELPLLMQGIKSRGLVVLWVPVVASLYTETPLVHFQAASDPSRPLSSLPKHKAQEELIKVAGAVKDSLKHRDISPEEEAQPAFNDLNISVKMSSVAQASLDVLKIPKYHLLQLLKAELASHKILTRIDYECIPRPLSSGLYVLLTKRGYTIIVESVDVHVLAKGKLELWKHLCAAYLEAYRLPFRSDHWVLIQRSEFRRTLRVLKQLIESLIKYIYQSKLFEHAKIYPRLHDLKRTAESNYLLAEDLYSNYVNSGGDEAILGRVALTLDLIISSVHKVTLEYGVRE